LKGIELFRGNIMNPVGSFGSSPITFAGRQKCDKDKTVAFKPEHPLYDVIYVGGPPPGVTWDPYKLADSSDSASETSQLEQSDTFSRASSKGLTEVEMTDEPVVSPKHSSVDDSMDIETDTLEMSREEYLHIRKNALEHTANAGDLFGADSPRVLQFFKSQAAELPVVDSSSKRGIDTIDSKENATASLLSRRDVKTKYGVMDIYSMLQDLHEMKSPRARTAILELVKYINNPQKKKISDASRELLKTNGLIKVRKHSKLKTIIVPEQVKEFAPKIVKLDPLWENEYTLIPPKALEKLEKQDSEHQDSRRLRKLKQ